MKEPFEELLAMPGNLKPGASMKERVQRSDGAMLGNLVGKDTGRNGCIMGQGSEVGQNPSNTTALRRNAEVVLRPCLIKAAACQLDCFCFFAPPYKKKAGTDLRLRSYRWSRAFCKYK